MYRKGKGEEFFQRLFGASLDEIRENVGVPVAGKNPKVAAVISSPKANKRMSGGPLAKQKSSSSLSLNVPVLPSSKFRLLINLG